jgi:predicted membrane protein
MYNIKCIVNCENALRAYSIILSLNYKEFIFFQILNTQQNLCNFTHVLFMFMLKAFDWILVKGRRGFR